MRCTMYTIANIIAILQNGLLKWYMNGSLGSNRDLARWCLCTPLRHSGLAIQRIN